MKILITVMKSISCSTCFANETSLERARQGKQFVCTIHKVVGFAESYDEFDATYKEMHELGYIPHKVINCTYGYGSTGRLYITWIRTHLEVR